MASKVITIHAGETVVVPSGTEITALILNGAISVTSTCNNLPTPTAQQCYAMEWSVSENDTNNYTLENTDSVVNWIKIGGVQYNIGIQALGDAGNLELAFRNIGLMLPGVFDVIDMVTFPLAHRDDLRLFFKSIPAIASGIEMNITGDGFFNTGLIVRPYDSDDCE